MHTAEFVASYFDAWNHSDPKGVADHLTADGIYLDIPENQQSSHDELIKSLSVFFTNHRHRYELIGEILTGRDTIAFQYQMYPFEKDEHIDAPNAVCGAEFMTLHGDAAMTITDYYDIPGTDQSLEFVRTGSIEAQKKELQKKDAQSKKAQKNKYAKSGLNSQQLLAYKNRLEHVMRSQQAFLRPDLTLPKLAEAVGCSVNHLSQVINSGFGMRFFDYLNQHRIEHARELMTDLDGSNVAILNIAFTVGFNSNSAFYAAFKKSVGQTPAHYRRELLKKLD